MWKLVTEEHFINQERIFPAAQESVLKIVKNAQGLSSVKRVTAFGSCTEGRFSPASDIDIFVEQEAEGYLPVAKGVWRGVDYWTQFSCDAALLREIERNGVVVYEKREPVGQGDAQPGGSSVLVTEAR